MERIAGDDFDSPNPGADLQTTTISSRGGCLLRSEIYID